MNDQVYTAALENASFFRDRKYVNGEALHLGFDQLSRSCAEAGPLLDRLRLEAPKYDLDADTPANGYRSFLSLFDACFQRCLELCQLVTRQRNSRTFVLYTAKHAEDLNAWNQVLLTLRAFLDHLIILLEQNEKKDNACTLLDLDNRNTRQFLLKVMSIRRYSFYGRHAAFPYYPSIERVFKSMLTFLATYSEYYYRPGNQLHRLMTFLSDGPRYFLDTDCRAKRIVHVSQFASIDFCKTFWRLAQNDFVKRVPQRLVTRLPVVQVIHLPPLPLRIRSVDNRMTDIPIPTAHGPPAPILIRLLSSKCRPGMPGYNEMDPLVPPSNFLIIHCHGGGFVAQDSQAHECYLRDWAVALDVPIVSIDYSLAPEFPYPRQLQEILYAYAWILTNSHLLGSLAEKIIFVGDSAGANLMLAMTLRAIDLNLRLPIGLLLAYVPLLIRIAPSPSRLLCLVDPLLPFGFMSRCLKAYAGDIDISAATDEESPPSEDTSNSPADIEGESLLFNQHRQSPYLSPILAPDAVLRKLPPIRLVSVELDPCLDDSVDFAKRCQRLGCDITLEVLPNLPHGFLSFCLFSPEAKAGSNICIQKINELIERAEPDF